MHSHFMKNPSINLAYYAVSALLWSGSGIASDFTSVPVTVGGGARTSFTQTAVKGSSEADSADFLVESIRIYLNGEATETLKFTVNTEYDSTKNTVVIMDAVARFELAPEFNLWAGRLLPPSDRSNLYGPFYANNWGVYRDGVQDFYADVAFGRANGAAYWGDFGGLKVSAGAFDIPATSAGSQEAKELLYAARLMYDFWDKEKGYYLNSTYFGDLEVLAIGAAVQTAAGDTSFNVDVLLEKKLDNASVVTIESQYAHYEGITSRGGLGSQNEGYYILGSYLFPKPTGIGKVQLLGKFGTTTFSESGPDPELTTIEANVGYVIRDFNARLYTFVIDQSWDRSNRLDAVYGGLGLQVQM